MITDKIVNFLASSLRTEGTTKVEDDKPARTSHRDDEPIHIVYDGVIHHDVILWVLQGAVKGYRWAVEVRSLPDSKWFRSLKQQTYWHQGEDCMGNPYSQERTHSLYTVMRKDPMLRDRTEAFILFNNEDDYNKALNDLADLIQNPWPFKTIASR